MKSEILMAAEAAITGKPMDKAKKSVVGMAMDMVPGATMTTGLVGMGQAFASWWGAKKTSGRIDDLLKVMGTPDDRRTGDVTKILDVDDDLWDMLSEEARRKIAQHVMNIVDAAIRNPSRMSSMVVPGLANRIAVDHVKSVLQGAEHVAHAESA
jgi:hypothetical protein